MSVFAQAARLLGTLAGLGQQGAGLGLGLSGGSGFSTEYIVGSATSAGGDLGASVLTPFGGKMITSYIKSLSPVQRMNLTNRMGGTAGAKQFAKGLSIIAWTITIVDLMELTIGFGPPTEGADLKAGSQQFSALAAQLTSALPKNESWEGSASDAYADLDTALQNLAQSMAALDSQLASLVENQAEWVTHARFIFGILKDVLLAAMIIEMIMTLTVPAPAGPIAAKAFAIAVATLGIGVATTCIGTVTYFSVTNGQKAEALANQYADLASGTTQTGQFAQAKVTTSEQSTVSSFDAISNSMSGMSALSAIPAPAAPAAKASNGSEDERSALTAQTSAGGPPAAGSPETPATPDPTTPSTPSATMPNVAQLSAMSGQASKLSGQLSQPANLVSQAAGQLQQMVQSAQQGQGAAAPAEEAVTEEAALAGDAAGAGAGVGTQGAERAPVEAAAGAERAQGPGPTGRIA